MTALNKQALLRAAVKVGAHTWEAEGSRVWSMSNGKADSLVLEVFGDETSGQQDCDIASFIAEASPANVLMLLDEQSESQACKANESDCADSAINLAINWQMRCKDAEAKLEAAEKLATQQGNIAVALLDEVTTLRRNADDKAPELRAQLIDADNELETLRQRIAELEAKLANPVLLPKTNGYWTEQEKAYEDAITLAKRQVRLAGFSVEDM